MGVCVEAIAGFGRFRSFRLIAYLCVFGCCALVDDCFGGAEGKYSIVYSGRSGVLSLKVRGFGVVVGYITFVERGKCL